MLLTSFYQELEYIPSCIDVETGARDYIITYNKSQDKVIFISVKIYEDFLYISTNKKELQLYNQVAIIKASKENNKSTLKGVLKNGKD